MDLIPMAILMHDWLFLWTVHTKLGWETCMKLMVRISSICVLICSIYLKAEDNAIHSTSSGPNAISDCNTLCQYIGQLAYMLTIPVLDKTLSVPLKSACYQPPAKSVCTQYSKPFEVSGLQTMPSCLVWYKYLPGRLMTFSWRIISWLQKWAVW